MNKDMINRLRQAGKYERMAIRALFPEKTAKHIEVIENEVQTMLMELVTDAMKCEKADAKEGTNKEQSSKVKKVNIG